MPTDEFLRQWGENIRTQREAMTPAGRRRKHGAEAVMTQAQLGDLLNPPVAQSTIARWEAGLMEPRRAYKAQLGRVLKIDVRLLFPLTAVPA